MIQADHPTSTFEGWAFVCRASVLALAGCGSAGEPADRHPPRHPSPAAFKPSPPDSWPPVHRRRTPGASGIVGPGGSGAGARGLGSRAPGLPGGSRFRRTIEGVTNSPTATKNHGPRRIAAGRFSARPPSGPGTYRLVAEPANGLLARRADGDPRPGSPFSHGCRSASPRGFPPRRRRPGATGCRACPPAAA